MKIGARRKTQTPLNLLSFSPQAVIYINNYSFVIKHDLTGYLIYDLIINVAALFKKLNKGTVISVGVYPADLERVETGLS